MDKILSLDDAYILLEKYNQEQFHLFHGKTVSGVMDWYAKKYDLKNHEHWAVVGMLHDIDYEKFPDEHCVKGEEVLRSEGVNENIIKSAMCHGFNMTKTTHEPKVLMEKILFAVDELTGLIWAVALVRPSKSVSDLKLKSVKKKFKDKNFAAGCSREVILQGAKNLDWELDFLIEETIHAMQSFMD